MKLHDLKPAPGAHRPRKRIGRGIGSGHGVTATRGSKGQKARAGYRMIPGFEGGQIRLIKRLPYKRGFNNKWRVAYETVNVGILGRRFSAGAAVDVDALSSAGLRRGKLPVKVLGDGAIGVALTVTAHKFSEAARKKIEAAGGTVVELGVKEVRGKARKIDADDVSIRHGETPRVRKKAEPTPSAPSTEPEPAAEPASE